MLTEVCAVLKRDRGSQICRSLGADLSTVAPDAKAELLRGRVSRKLRIRPGRSGACEAEGRVVFRYVDAAGKTSAEANPNGAQRNIAGICDARGRILGMMPHPERLFEPVLGGSDGRRLFESLLVKLH